MKTFLKSLILFILFAIPLFAFSAAHAATNDLRLLSVNSDGTYSEIPVTFSANGLIQFGGTGGTFQTTAPATFAAASSVPDYRSGDITFTVIGGVTKNVTFSSAFTVGTSWRVFINTSLLTTGYSVSSITSSGFTVTLPLAVAGTMSYYAVPTK